MNFGATLSEYAQTYHGHREVGRYRILSEANKAPLSLSDFLKRVKRFTQRVSVFSRFHHDKQYFPPIAKAQNIQSHEQIVTLKAQGDIKAPPPATDAPAGKGAATAGKKGGIAGAFKVAMSMLSGLLGPKASMGSKAKAGDEDEEEISISLVRYHQWSPQLASAEDFRRDPAGKLVYG